MSKYDPQRPETRTTCDTDTGLPILDALAVVPAAIGGGIVLVGGIQSAADASDQCTPCQNGATIEIAIGAGLLLTAVAFAWSASSGFSAASACERVK